MRLLIRLIPLLLATQGGVAQEGAQERQQKVERTISLLEGRAQKIADLSAQGSMACGRAQSAVQKVQDALPGLSQSIDGIEQTLTDFKNGLTKLQERGQQSYLWQTEYRSSVVQLTQSRLESTKIAHTACGPRSEGEELYRQIVAAQDDAQAAYERIESVHIEVDQFWIALQELEMKVAAIALQIDQARIAESQIERELHEIQVERAIANNSFSEVLQLANSSQPFSHSATQTIAQYPDEFTAEKVDQLERAIAQIKSAQKVNTKCLEQLQRSLSLFEKRYDEAKRRLNETYRKSVIYAASLHSGPGVIEVVRDLREEMASQSQAVQAALEEIDQNVERVERCV